MHFIVIHVHEQITIGKFTAHTDGENEKKTTHNRLCLSGFFLSFISFFPPVLCAHVCMSVLWFCRFIVVPAIMVALQYDYVHYTIATILNKVHFHAYVKHVLVIKYISFFFLFHSFSVSFFCLAFAVDS